jgi:hypothetical protein
MLDCEWEPEDNRPLTAFEILQGRSHAKAAWFFGYHEDIALCEECANLPCMSRYKVRKRIDTPLLAVGE